MLRPQNAEAASRHTPTLGVCLSPYRGSALDSQFRFPALLGPIKLALAVEPRPAYTNGIRNSLRPNTSQENDISLSRGCHLIKGLIKRQGCRETDSKVEG